ncbi:MAG: 50S ribosomal protein L25 [Deltaproteobacteria bacterium]|nr:50S ribosomal protein L25 [Deltaproteobacteria bacterium]
MAKYTLSAHIREDKGKEAAKKLRRDNHIPAVFYGPDTEPMMLSVDDHDLRKIMKQAAGENIVLGLQIESDKGSDSRVVMLKELQTDHIKDTYIHADFYEISMDKEITVDIPVRLVNIALGVTNGGILQHVRREITISCLPDKLIESVDVDVSELDIGDAVHISDIDLPEEIQTAQEKNLTVAVVVAPTVTEEVEEEVEEEIEEAEEKEGEEDKKAEKEGAGAESQAE